MWTVIFPMASVECQSVKSVILFYWVSPTQVLPLWLGADHPSVTWLMYILITKLPCTQGCTYPWHNALIGYRITKYYQNNNYKISLSTTHRSNWLLFHSVCINVGALILDLSNYTYHAHSHIQTSWYTHNFKNIHGSIKW